MTSALSGTIELTRWLEGTYPYLDQGGEIVVGGDGLAVPQGSSQRGRRSHARMITRRPAFSG